MRNFDYRRNTKQVNIIENQNKEFFDRLYGFADSDNMTEKKSTNLIQLHGLAKVISMSRGMSILGVHFGTNGNLTMDCNNRRMFHQFAFASTAREQSLFQCIEHRRAIFDTMAVSYPKGVSLFSQAVHNTQELLNRQYQPAFATEVVKGLLKQQCEYTMKSPHAPMFDTELGKAMFTIVSGLKYFEYIPENATLQEMRDVIDNLSERDIQNFVFGHKFLDTEGTFKIMRGEHTVSVAAYAAYKFGMDWENNPEAIAQVRVLEAACGIKVVSDVTFENQDIRQYLNTNGILDFNYDAIFNSLADCMDMDRERLRSPSLTNVQKCEIANTLNMVNDSMTGFVRGITESSADRNAGKVPQIGVVDDDASKMLEIAASEVQLEIDSMQNDNLM